MRSRRAGRRRRSLRRPPPPSPLGRAGTFAGHGYLATVTGGAWLLVLVPFVLTSWGRRRLAWPLWAFAGAALVWLVVEVAAQRPVRTEVAALDRAPPAATGAEPPMAPPAETRPVAPVGTGPAPTAPARTGPARTAPSSPPPAVPSAEPAQPSPATTAQAPRLAATLAAPAWGELRVAHAEIAEESGAAAAAMATCLREAASVACVREAYAGFVRDAAFAAETAGELAGRTRGRCHNALTAYGSALDRYAAVFRRANAAAVRGAAATAQAELRRRPPAFGRYAASARAALAACRRR